MEDEEIVNSNEKIRVICDAITTLHCLTVPYEENQPILGEETWVELFNTKVVLTELYNKMIKEVREELDGR